MGLKKILKKIKNMFVVEKIIPHEVKIYDGKMLTGKRVLITGATGGIGYAIAKAVVNQGGKVIISGRNEKKLKEICLELENATYIVFDMTKFDEYDSLLMLCKDRLNEDENLDVLVNCAGIHGPSDFWKINPKDWDEVMDINLKSLYFMSQSFGKYLKNLGQKGHILNVSSASQLKHGKTPYEISKSSVGAMTSGIAEEMIPYGIVVNSIAPGPTATSMLNYKEGDSIKWEGNPSGRMATANEIANWAVMLVSDMGEYIVGSTLYITGGSGTICIDK